MSKEICAWEGGLKRMQLCSVNIGAQSDSLLMLLQKIIFIYIACFVIDVKCGQAHITQLFLMSPCLVKYGQGIFHF